MIGRGKCEGRWEGWGSMVCCPFTSPRKHHTVVVLQYPWQIELLKRGVVTLSHAVCGCRLNHLHAVSLAVSVDVLLETRRVRLQAPKTVPATGPQQIRVKFPYVGLSSPCSQCHWLAQLTKVPRFNRSICQG